MDRWPLNDTGDPTAGLTNDGRLLWDQSLDSLLLQTNVNAPVPNLAGSLTLQSMPQNQTEEQLQINGTSQDEVPRKQKYPDVSSEHKVQPSTTANNPQQQRDCISRPQLRVHVKQLQLSKVPSSMQPRLDLVGIKRLCIAILRKMCISVTIAELPDIDLNAGSDADSYLVLPPKAMQFVTAMILGTSGDKDVSLTEGSQISNGDLAAMQRLVTLVMRSRGVTFNSAAPQDIIISNTSTINLPPLPPQVNCPAAMTNLLDITFALPTCTTRLFLRLYRFILCILLASPHSDPFVQPNPISTPIHGQVTQDIQTMDLSTVETKIWRGVYTTFSKFESDILLIKHNAQSMYGNQSDIPKRAENLYALFRKIVTSLKWQAMMPQVASKDLVFKPSELLPEELSFPSISSSTPICFVPTTPLNHLIHPSHPDYAYHIKNSAIFELVSHMKTSPSDCYGPLPRLHVARNLSTLLDDASPSTLLAVFHNTSIEFVRNNTHNVVTDVLVSLMPGPSAVYGTDVDGNNCNIQNATKGFLFVRPVCVIEKMKFAINDRVKELCFNNLYSVVRVDTLCKPSASQDAVTRRIILNIRSMVSSYVVRAFHATSSKAAKNNEGITTKDSGQIPGNNGLQDAAIPPTINPAPGIKVEKNALVNNNGVLPPNVINELLKTACDQGNHAQIAPIRSYSAVPSNDSKNIETKIFVAQSDLSVSTATETKQAINVHNSGSTQNTSANVLKRSTSGPGDDQIAVYVKKIKTEHSLAVPDQTSPKAEATVLGSPDTKFKAIQEATPDSPPPPSKPVVIPEDTLPAPTENSGKEIDHDVWRRLFKACRMKGVAVRNISEKYADLNWAAPDSEGFFKQVYFWDDVVIQLFRQMTMYQRVTEVACLMKLRNLPHMAQLVEVLYNDNGDVVGLSVERYQTTLKQFAHAHSHHRLTAHQKRSIIEQMLVCMKSIHEAGLAHRDLSEVNFMVNALDRRLPDGSQDVHLYLIDFGKSLFCNADDMREWFVDVKREAGEYQGDVVPETKEELEEWCQTLPWVKGKPDHGYRMYRSIQTLPKARKDDKILPWLIHPQAEDMYSIAVMIWKIFAETEPWQGILDTDLQGLRFVVQDDYRIQKAVEREIHGPVSQEFVLKCLKTQPQDRATAAQMLEWFLQEDIKANLVQEWKTYSSTTRSSRSHRRR